MEKSETKMVSGQDEFLVYRTCPNAAGFSPGIFPTTTCIGFGC